MMLPCPLRDMTTAPTPQRPRSPPACEGLAHQGHLFRALAVTSPDSQGWASGPRGESQS
jgi:hypothetical protein